MALQKEGKFGSLPQHLQLVLTVNLVLSQGCLVPPPIVCDESIQVEDAHIETSDPNLRRCEFGPLERFKSDVCLLEEGTCQPNSVPDECVASGDCEVDEACFDSIDGCYCAVDTRCRTDDDCGASQACLCGSVSENSVGDSRSAGSCVPAECRTSADCGETERCLLSFFGCEMQGFFCVAPDAECVSRSDCSGDAFCVSDGTTRRCRTSSCVIG